MDSWAGLDYFYYMTENLQRRIVLVTGLSGAGMSTALKALEDMGYEVIDNLPIALVGAAVDNMIADERPLALGIDCRTRDFSAEALENCLTDLRDKNDVDVKLALIDCHDNVLQHRFSETRRRHPMAADRSVIDGIETERKLLQPLFEVADEVMDTSELTVHDLRRGMAAKFRNDRAYGLMVLVTSFGFRNGIPRDADLVFDVRFMWNPHYDPRLKPLTGRDPEIQARLSAEESFDSFFKNLTVMLEDLLPRYQQEGKSYLTIGIGCTGGRHRSVFTAEKLYEWLGQKSYSTAIKHRDLERWMIQQKQRGDNFDTTGEE